MESSRIVYTNPDGKDFNQVVNQRVSEYFKANNKSRYGGGKVILKGLFFLSFLIIPYAYILIVQPSEWTMLALCMVMGFGIATVGVNVMHEACHESFAQNKFINWIASQSMHFLAGDKSIWQASHNVLHHTYTNIYGHDIDLHTGGGVIRFSKRSTWKPMHRRQHIYAWFLYGLLTINWVFISDFRKLSKLTKLNVHYGKPKTPLRKWSGLIITKLGLWTLWLVIPAMVLNVPFWKIFIGYFAMHWLASLFLTLVFQLAHLTGEVKMPEASSDMEIADSWAVHQMKTTANWAINNPAINFVMGGLNFQIEHHLLPHVSHVHYKSLVPIIKKTAAEFKVPYNEFSTFYDALEAHYYLLRSNSLKPQSELENA